MRIKKKKNFTQNLITFHWIINSMKQNMFSFQNRKTCLINPLKLCHDFQITKKKKFKNTHTLAIS